jgi:hypothetical protein
LRRSGCASNVAAYMKWKGQRHRAVLLLATVAILLAGGWFVLSRHKDEAAHSKALPTRKTIMAATWRQLSDRGLEEVEDSHAHQGLPFAALQGNSRKFSIRMRRAVSETLGPARSLGLRFDRARYASTPIGVDLWMVPGRGVTCLVRAKTAASVCNTTVVAERRGILLEIFKPGTSPQDLPTRFLALGIAPNWTKKVQVKVGRKVRTIPVIDNAYGIRANVPIQFQRLTR